MRKKASFAITETVKRYSFLPLAVCFKAARLFFITVLIMNRLKMIINNEGIYVLMQIRIISDATVTAKSHVQLPLAT